MRHPERLSLLPLLGGLTLLLALTLIGATRFNSAEQREILDRTGSQLSAYTSTAAAMVTVWTGVQGVSPSSRSKATGRSVSAISAASRRSMS